MLGRNKLSATLNAREADGQALVKKLVEGSDMLLENFRPGTMERWGLGYDVLSEINPKLIMIRVSGFEKRYKTRVAVQALNLTVNPGEMYGLIGPDGAGKSSLMKAVAGVLSYEGGSVEVFGVTVDSEQAAERRRRNTCPAALSTPLSGL